MTEIKNSTAAPISGGLTLKALDEAKAKAQSIAAADDVNARVMVADGQLYVVTVPEDYVGDLGINKEDASPNLLFAYQGNRKTGVSEAGVFYKNTPTTQLIDLLYFAGVPRSEANLFAQEPFTPKSAGDLIDHLMHAPITASEVAPRAVAVEFLREIAQGNQNLSAEQLAQAFVNFGQSNPAVLCPDGWCRDMYNNTLGPSASIDKPLASSKGAPFTYGSVNVGAVMYRGGPENCSLYERRDRAGEPFETIKATGFAALNATKFGAIDDNLRAAKDLLNSSSGALKSLWTALKDPAEMKALASKSWETLKGLPPGVINGLNAVSNNPEVQYRLRALLRQTSYTEYVAFVAQLASPAVAESLAKNGVVALEDAWKAGAAMIKAGASALIEIHGVEYALAPAVSGRGGISFVARGERAASTVPEVMEVRSVNISTRSSEAAASSAGREAFLAEHSDNPSLEDLRHTANIRNPTWRDVTDERGLAKIVELVDNIREGKTAGTEAARFGSGEAGVNNFLDDMVNKFAKSRTKLTAESIEEMGKQLMKGAVKELSGPIDAALKAGTLKAEDVEIVKRAVSIVNEQFNDVIRRAMVAVLKDAIQSKPGELAKVFSGFVEKAQLIGKQLGLGTELTKLTQSLLEEKDRYSIFQKTYERLLGPKMSLDDVRKSIASRATLQALVENVIKLGS